MQCGFCTPGMIVAATELLEKIPAPTAGEIREALAGQLCMCTGYVNIVKAVEQAAATARRRDGRGIMSGPGSALPARQGRRPPRAGRGRFIDDLGSPGMLPRGGAPEPARATPASARSTRGRSRHPGVTAVLTGPRPPAVRADPAPHSHHRRRARLYVSPSTSCATWASPWPRWPRWTAPPPRTPSS
jgi:hypothetical protein